MEVCGLGRRKPRPPLLVGLVVCDVCLRARVSSARRPRVLLGSGLWLNAVHWR